MEQYADMRESGVSWIQNIPDAWGVRALFQLVVQVKNKNKDLLENNLLSLSYGKIKRKDINNPEGLLPESFDGYNIIEENDIVLRLTDLQNDHTSLRVGQTKERGIITSAYTTLRPTENVNYRYLYYVLHAYDLIKGFYGMGSGVRQSLNYDEVKMLKVPFPVIEDQIEIARYLDDITEQIDSAILEAKNSIDDYRKWRASIICETITRGIVHDCELKSSGVEWIGDIPSSWKIKKIKYFGRQSTIRSETNDGYIGLENVESASGRYLPSKDKVFEAEGTSLKVEKGDVLFGKLRPYLAKCIIAENPGCCSTEFIVIRPKDCDTRYLKYVMLCPKFIDVVNMSTYGAKMPRANWDFIGNVKAPFPPQDVQKEIADELEYKLYAIDELINEKIGLIDDLETYKRSIIYETVTGKRKVV